MFHFNSVRSAIVVAALASVVVLAFQNCGEFKNGTVLGETSAMRSAELGRDLATSTSEPKPATCTFNGQTVGHGESVVAYLASIDPAGCQAETRQCSDGTLSGSYTFAKCEKMGLKSCIFDGKQVMSGASVMAYHSAKSEPGQSCKAESRVCMDGMLSGTFTFATCAGQGPAACQFNGKTVESGSSVTAFLEASVPYGTACTMETRVCTNGMLSGSNKFAACVVDKPAPCLFDGRTLAHGESVKAFRVSSVEFGKLCETEAETIRCENGKMSKTGLFASCAVGQPASCQHLGKTVVHGQALTAFRVATVDFGNSCDNQKANLTCNNGVFTPSAQEFPHASCAVKPAASCNYHGQTIADGQSVTAYRSATVPAGGNCALVSGSLRCSNGNLGPSPNEFPFATCSVLEAPKTCDFEGAIIANGQTVNGFRSNFAKWPASCEPGPVTCVEGVLQNRQAFPFTYCQASHVVTDPVLEIGQVGYNGGHATVTLAVMIPPVPNFAPTKIVTTVSGNQSFVVAPQYREFMLPADGNYHPIQIELRPSSGGVYEATINVLYDDQRFGYKVWRQPLRATAVPGIKIITVSVGGFGGF